jgi:ribosome biogenesis GTPase
MLKTREVRAHDSRGRHTTRHRHLIVLPDRRGLLIDTPGMRELQLWTQAESIRETFDDIEALAAGCRFTDCRHRDEPRCAVKEAVDAGTLAPERWHNYLKLQEELQSLDARKQAREQINVKRRFKSASQSMKKFYKDRPKGEQR